MTEVTATVECTLKMDATAATGLLKLIGATSMLERQKYGLTPQQEEAVMNVYEALGATFAND